MTENNIYDVWLTVNCGSGSIALKKLIEKYNAKTLYFMNFDEIESLEIDSTLKTCLKNKNTDRAKYICELCHKKNIDIITYNDDTYPPLLRMIKNPPYLLYKKGLNIDFKNFPIAGIVGSRLLSEYGKMVTENLSYDMAKMGFLITSGMALGADGYAHLSAMNAKAPTVAILGCGVDIVYPFQNKNIYDYICENGAVLSEFPPETKPQPFHFPMRNRIVSGMSHFTVVTEARLKSGSLITAKDAHNQGRAVFAVPQNINSPYGQGTNQLLKEYAQILTDAKDLWEYYVKTFGVDTYAPILEKAKPTKKKTAETPPVTPKNLSEEEMAIINVLKGGVTHINKITDKTGLTLGKASATASLLEIKGLIYSVSGNSYGLVSHKI